MDPAVKRMAIQVEDHAMSHNSFEGPLGDGHVTLWDSGEYEQGGRAALPLWLGYMQKAIKGKKTPEFEPTDGVVFVRIDPKTGNRARDDTEGTVSEAIFCPPSSLSRRRPGSARP